MHHLQVCLEVSGHLQKLQDNNNRTNGHSQSWVPDADSHDVSLLFIN